MRIVLDTNVLVSGLMNPGGRPGQVIDLLLSGKLHLLYDDRILREYLNVLARPQLGIRPNHAAAVVGYIRLSGERVSVLPLPDDTLPDLGDLAFAEVLISGKGDALVTVNRKLNTVQQHFEPLKKLGIEILSPAEMVARFAQGVNP